MLWAKNDYHHYFDRIEGSESMTTLKNKARASSENGVQIIKAENFNNNDASDEDDSNDKHAEISQLLSNIELKRA